MCKLYQPQGLEKIPEINKRRAFNKAIGPGKNAQLITIGPTSIPDSRVPMEAIIMQPLVKHV